MEIRIRGCGRGNAYNRCQFSNIYRFLPCEYDPNQELPFRMWRVTKCFEMIEKQKLIYKKEKPITKGEQKVFDRWVSQCDEEMNEIGRLLCDKQSPPKKMIVIKLSTEQSTKRKHRIEDDEPLSEVLMRIQIEQEAAMV